MNTTVIEKPAKVAKNGVDVPTLLATIGVVKDMPPAAKFQFRAKGQWVTGTYSKTTMNGYFGAGAEQRREADFVVEGDHPAVLCGGDRAPTPPEQLLSALAACITAGIGNIASVRQIDLESVETVIEGDIDLQGMLGLNEQVRNGFEGIRVTVNIKGNAGAAELEKVVQQSVARSAVFDMLTNGTKVDVAVAA